MKLNSLRHRLIVLILICLIAMLTLVSSQIFYINRLVQAQTDSTVLLQLNAEILQLRRHEKDFMLRLDPIYAQEFEQRAVGLRTELIGLGSIVDSYTLPPQQLVNIQKSFEQYTGQFASLVQLKTAIGLDEVSGQRGEFRRNIHLLEDALEQADLKTLSLLMLQLRRHEKDFLLRQELSYVTQGQETYEQLRELLLQSELADQVAVLDSYQKGFTDIVTSYTSIGLTPDLGLQGEFRDAAHELEDQLTNLGMTLNPLIQQREQDVKVNGFIITLVTAVILLTLLVRNFIKLQNALSSFLLFFHQSKHSYQPLDVKKMGYAEFETLASVANEMIDSRRGMEADLKKAEESVALLKSQASKN
ncbi:MAG: hypothetical protein AB8B95_00105 [Pseudohongiellaceae bacterium]